MADGTNAERMTRNSVCDGVRILWREVGHDLEQQNLSWLKMMVLNNTECEAHELTKYIKHKVLREDGHRLGRLVSVNIWGPAAAVVRFLPWQWFSHITEYHAKTWTDEVFADATTAFVDRLYATDDLGLMKASFFGKDKRKTKKSGGSKGGRLGAKNSDVQAISYKRQNQRAGHEVRIKDKVLLRIWREVDETKSVAGGAISDETLSMLYHMKAARTGFVKFLAELKRRGIRFTDYFSTTTQYFQGAVGADMFEDLNPMEDAAIITG